MYEITRKNISLLQEFAKVGVVCASSCIALLANRAFSQKENDIIDLCLENPKTWVRYFYEKGICALVGVVFSRVLTGSIGIGLLAGLISHKIIGLIGQCKQGQLSINDLIKRCEKCLQTDDMPGAEKYLQLALAKLAKSYREEQPPKIFKPYFDKAEEFTKNGSIDQANNILQILIKNWVVYFPLRYRNHNPPILSIFEKQKELNIRVSVPEKLLIEAIDYDRGRWNKPNWLVEGGNVARIAKNMLDYQSQCETEVVDSLTLFLEKSIEIFQLTVDSAPSKVIDILRFIAEDRINKGKVIDHKIWMQLCSTEASAFDEPFGLASNNAINFVNVFNFNVIYKMEASIDCLTQLLEIGKISRKKINETILFNSHDNENQFFAMIPENKIISTIVLFLSPKNQASFRCTSKSVCMFINTGLSLHSIENIIRNVIQTIKNIRFPPIANIGPALNRLTTLSEELTKTANVQLQNDDTESAKKTIECAFHVISLISHPKRSQRLLNDVQNLKTKIV